MKTNSMPYTRDFTAERPPFLVVLFSTLFVVLFCWVIYPYKWIRLLIHNKKASKKIQSDYSPLLECDYRNAIVAKYQRGERVDD